RVYFLGTCLCIDQVLFIGCYFTYMSLLSNNQRGRYCIENSSNNQQGVLIAIFELIVKRFKRVLKNVYKWFKKSRKPSKNICTAMAISSIPISRSIAIMPFLPKYSCIAVAENKITADASQATVKAMDSVAN